MSFQQDNDNNSGMLIDRSDEESVDPSAEAESQKLVKPREEFQIFPEGVYIEQSASIFSENEDTEEHKRNKIKKEITPISS